MAIATKLSAYWNQPVLDGSVRLDHWQIDFSSGIDRIDVVAETILIDVRRTATRIHHAARPGAWTDVSWIANAIGILVRRQDPEA